MPRRPIAATLALAIALAGFGARPAAATEPADIARALGGVAALYIVGQAIRNGREESDDRDAEPKRVSDRHGDHRYDFDDPRRRFEPAGRGAHRYRERARRHERRHDRWHDRWDRRDRVPYRSPGPLPGVCRTRGIVNSQGMTDVFDAGCLDRRYGAARRLPDVCRVRFLNAGGPATGYHEMCLRRLGYGVGRH